MLAPYIIEKSNNLPKLNITGIVGLDELVEKINVKESKKQHYNTNILTEILKDINIKENDQLYTSKEDKISKVNHKNLSIASLNQIKELINNIKEQHIKY